MPWTSSRQQRNQGEQSDRSAPAPSRMNQMSTSEDRMAVIESRLDDISRQLAQLTEITQQQNATRVIQTPCSMEGETARINTTSMAQGLPTPVCAATGSGSERQEYAGSYIEPSPMQHWAV